ncbi:MAG: 30S ribosomal protein S6 [Deltaproteobacteria bacterium]|jgi:small subunit ribosomal protein S6|nr:30S ribosomal protein S6 [Deltaproteobacteria bacterium]
MRYYETLYIINPNLAEEDYRAVVAKFSDAVEKNKGVVTKVDEWGKKTLAYDIKKFDKGYYVLLQYCGEAGLTAELKRELGLDDRILKYQTIKLSDDADLEKLKPKPDPGEPEPVETVEVEKVEVEAVEEAENSGETGTEGEGEKDGL